MLGAELVFAFHGPLIKRDAEIFERKRMKQIWLAILHDRRIKLAATRRAI